jgi:hypothetical protein
MCTSCTKTNISGKGNGRGISPSKVTFANRVVNRPSGTSSNFGSPKVTARFSGRGK